MRSHSKFLTRQLTAARNLWRYRELAAVLAVRNLKVKYMGSALGLVWTLLNPMMMVLILVAVFTIMVPVMSEGFWAFLISGYFVFNFFSQTLNSSTLVLSQHGSLSRAVAFPKDAPILAAALSRLVEFCIELALVLLALAIFHHGHVPASFLVLPWLVTLQLMLALSFAFPIATLSAFYHDVRHAMPALLRALFYLSPVFYSVARVPEGVRPLYMANPMARLLELYHLALYSGQTPELAPLLNMSAIAIVLLVIGYAVFNHYQHLFAELV